MTPDRPAQHVETTLHAAALRDLRRGGKAAAILFGGVFGILGLFVMGGLVVAQQQVPARPADTPAPTGSVAAGEPGAPSPAMAAAWRQQLVSFLTSAGEPGHAGADRWFPGAASETDGFTYSPVSDTDPGAGRPDRTARVHHRDLSASDAAAVFRAVSRNGAIAPSTLEVSSAAGTDKDRTLKFTLRTKDGALLAGEARLSTRESEQPVILRLVYGS
ncbi:hypothetical protein [Streptomyces sp. Isolate_45]|uniref:hypothetical protein n=1 Tax=Streptomyces sp. Isolate_45 TaxID=2950111 RepID=UPI002481D2B3|nr:hypothetical protein [Streptomyces sp. Isolate_45]MDA5282541.1 hypothetical protein [Streptomyces sp. Isolate_45]